MAGFFIAGAAAVAAWKINKPVRLVLDLKSNMALVGMREAYLAQYKAGVDSEGLLQFVDITFNNDTGWSHCEALTLGQYRIYEFHPIPFTF